ncbi:Eukaryotic initiation factor 4E family protein [Histomonas meleagridis]|uniref:Eukaryotic initiation factor 4E family protein n=1 Tax=Histomonas meleagridis TaxID=135588 RepID=UPI003559E045|nr:Eukaryotic initiation factor 4E family protein [Histomonas meleagridis]KAH0803844.1 Eukaryotic initiation factor 4E family protein [Histomonas meleagridis]
MAHKLQDEWSFYGFTMPTSEEANESYSEHIKLLSRFSTVEEFWTAYSHIIRPSSLPNQDALHIFRGKSRAMREDPEHQDGGSFLFRVSKGLASYYWEQLILALIGGRLPDDVIGILISARPKYYNISIWQKNADNEELRMDICKKFCEYLHLPLQTRIDFSKHNKVLSIEEDGKHPIHYILQEDGPVCKEIQPRNKPSEEKSPSNPVNATHNE